VPVGVVDAAARALAGDLLDTMRASPACVGLAAPQIGVGSRALVVDVSGHPKATSSHGVVVLFDPSIVAAGPTECAREGCMSVPDLTGDVARPRAIVVRGLDLEGEWVELACEGFEARAVAHELDHLDGLVFLDRVQGPGSVYARKVYR
jgi:peptide deformylase